MSVCEWGACSPEPTYREVISVLAFLGVIFVARFGGRGVGSGRQLRLLDRCLLPQRRGHVVHRRTLLAHGYQQLSKRRRLPPALGALPAGSLEAADCCSHKSEVMRPSTSTSVHPALSTKWRTARWS